MKQFDQLAGIIRAKFRLTVIPTKRFATIAALFKAYSMDTGMSVHLWNHFSGLQTLEQDSIVIPDTKSPNDVLEYIQNSIHYSIYLLQDFPYNATSKTTNLFNQLMQSQGSFNGKIVLMGEHFQLDPRLQEQTLFVNCGGNNNATPQDEIDVPYIPMRGSMAASRR